jgi:hypothetical protein
VRKWRSEANRTGKNEGALEQLMAGPEPQHNSFERLFVAHESEQAAGFRRVRLSMQGGDEKARKRVEARELEGTQIDPRKMQGVGGPCCLGKCGTVEGAAACCSVWLHNIQGLDEAWQGIGGLALLCSVHQQNVPPEFCLQQSRLRWTET